VTSVDCKGRAINVFEQDGEGECVASDKVFEFCHWLMLYLFAPTIKAARQQRQSNVSGLMHYSDAVLSSLLPGLRNLRTPLAVGYLWIVALWLLLHDHIPKTLEQAATEPAKSLFELGSLLGGPAARVLARL
jgi:hypothetical protein